jgi:HAD superfamily hydrolase (TIGR01509 family)
MKKAIIFDFDGTMFDNLSVYKDAHKRMFSKRNLEYKFLPNTKGSKTIELMQTFADYFKNELGEEISAEDLLKEQDEIVFKEYEEKVQMRKGLLEFLNFLNENKIRKFVATTARLSTVKILFDKYNLWQEFDIILTAEDIQNSKPDPEIYNKIFEKLNQNSNFSKIEKKDCLAIEDARSGVESAINAEIEVVAIPNEHAFNKDEDLSISNYVMESFEDEKLREIILK